MGFNTRLYGSIIFHRRFSVLLWVHLIYYTYARSNCFRHADGFSFSFVLIQKKRKRKEKIKATSPGLLRKGRSGAEKRTRSVALRSDSIFQRRPAIPTLTPLRLGQSFFHAKALRCWLLAFWFYNATVLRPHLFTSPLDLMAPSFLCSFLEFIVLKNLPSRTEFSILRLSI